MLFITYFSTLFLFSVVNCDLESFVIGGTETKISNYPHSVYLNIACKESFICGGSIVNQKIVLTAGHCLESCKSMSSTEVILKYGHEHIDRMKSTSMMDFVIHEKYDEEELRHDIALVLVNRPFRLDQGARRVAITKTPPNIKMGYTAGWGLFIENRASVKLLYTMQELQPPKVCNLLGPLPWGSFCAGPIKGTGFPNSGDSGSALVVQQYVQIGLVSFKVERYSLVVYTNVSYYYDWIKSRSVKLFCKDRKL